MKYLALIDIKPTPLTPPKQFVDQAWAYVLPSITAYATAAIAYKVVVMFLKAAKGE